MTSPSRRAQPSPAVPLSDVATLRRLLALLGPLRARAARGVLFRFLQSFFLGLALGAVVWVVTELARGLPVSDLPLWPLVAGMGVSLTGQMACGYLAARDSWAAGFLLARDLRLSLLVHLRRLPMSFHLSRHRGDSVTVLTTDVQTLAAFVSEALPRIVQAFGLPVVALAFLAWRDWVVGLAALAAFASAIPVFVWSGRLLARLGIERQDSQARAGAGMIEYAQGIATIRAFNQMAGGEEKFRGSLDRFRDVSVRMVARLTIPLALFGAVVMAGIPLLIAVAALRWSSGVLDGGALIAILLLSFALFGPLLGLIPVMELTRLAEASLNRIDRILSAPVLPPPTAPRRPKGFEVCFRGVGFAYEPGRPVLRDLDFTIPERTMTAVVGPSGAGKSTILNLLPRFWDVGTGQVTIGGVDIREIDEEVLNGMVTVVFQQVHLFSGTIFENIAIGREGASAEQVMAAAQAAQAHAFVSALPEGYRTRVGEAGATLSGGERQRIAIARAILKDAPIVLLDEVTAAIDPLNEGAIREALARLVADKTLIVVAHRLSTIRHADQILVVDDGEIVERGTHELLITSGGLYRRLWHCISNARNWRLRPQ